MRGDTLNIRLKAIAELIPPGARIVDVGTDHAKLPAHLVHTGRASRAIATDIAPGPLAMAAAELARTGVSGVELRLCDGLDSLPVERIDEVVIAGMGGELIADIVTRCQAVHAPGKGIVCQPMSRAESLRGRMAQAGFSATAEKLAYEDGRYFVAMRYEYTGTAVMLDEAEARIGRLLRDGDPLAVDYIRWQIGVLERSAAAAGQSANGAQAAARYRSLITRLGEYLTKSKETL